MNESSIEIVFRATVCADGVRCMPHSHDTRYPQALSLMACDEVEGNLETEATSLGCKTKFVSATRYKNLPSWSNATLSLHRWGREERESESESKSEGERTRRCLCMVMQLSRH
jgi:hypothetical protein